MKGIGNFYFILKIEGKILTDKNLVERQAQ
jgi:hypothetical protein